MTTVGGTGGGVGFAAGDATGAGPAEGPGGRAGVDPPPPVMIGVMPAFCGEVPHDVGIVRISPGWMTYAGAFT